MLSVYSLFYLVIILYIENSLAGETSHYYYREGVPRFKNHEKEIHEVYLGDHARLPCNAISRTPLQIMWFHNGEPLTADEIAENPKFRDNKNHQTLDIRDVDVSHQGLWTCKVWNSVGHISRNFTVEIIDPVKLFDWLADSHSGDISHLLPSLLPFGRADQIKQLLGPKWSKLNKIEKKIRARAIVREMSEMYNPETTTFDDDEDDDSIEIPVISPDKTLTGEPVIMETPPMFKNTDQYHETIVSPAGKTLRLNCKADGQPTPKVVWRYNKDKVITQKTARPSNGDYRFTRWSLEIEDAVGSDSGMYSCEVWNIAGSINRLFNVTVINRMRSPPFIVPNVLQNQTVNVNGTAVFRCQVFSDLMPHIMWVRINKANGNYYYYNETAKEHMFNYTEMDTVERTLISHRGDQSTLKIFNVTQEDQGLYGCITGNSLGTTMANATLIVNDFNTIEIPTGDSEPEVSVGSIIGVLLLVFFCVLVTMAAIMYLICVKMLRNKEKDMDDRMGLMPKKKKVIVTQKKHPDDAEMWSDLPSTYQIQIVEQAVSGTRQRRMRHSSEVTTLLSLSEYEVDSDPQWEIDRSRLELVSILGEGAFGEVWKAMLKPDKAEIKAGDDVEKYPVAVKKLKSSAHEKELIDLVSEMTTLKVIGRHENLLRLIGCCTGSGPLYVVLELCKHGNLRDFLRAHRPKEEKREYQNSENDKGDYLEPRRAGARSEEQVLIPNLTQRHLVEFASQVAKGMAYMASRKIIHRDLAARNVLVADQFVLKISDFGLSRDVHCNDYYRKKGNGRLPIKWMALEALDSHVYTIESDIWSFGILLWEIMTLGGTPYPTIAMPQLYSCLKDGYRMEAPHNCPEEMYNLMIACWQEKRETRPSFETIVYYLDWMLNQSDEVEEQGDNNNNPPGTDSDNMGPSSSPAPTSSSGSLSRKKKTRPLSAPVNLPSEPQHSICDDIEDDGDLDFLGSAEARPENEPTDNIGNPNSHYYANDIQPSPPHTTHNWRSARQQTDPSSTSINQSPGKLNGTSNSVDSAIGSPAWHISNKSNSPSINKVHFLGESDANRDMSDIPSTSSQQQHNYMNIGQTLTTRFRYPPQNGSDATSQSRSNSSGLDHGSWDSAFYGDSHIQLATIDYDPRSMKAKVIRRLSDEKNQKVQPIGEETGEKAKSLPRLTTSLPVYTSTVTNDNCETVL